MNTKRSGLGRNLSALLNTPKNVTAATGSPFLPISSLQPGKYQPRRDMDDNNLQELAASIKKQGLLQPVVVREIEAGRYEIIAGERRWRACQLAEMQDIPVIVRQVDDETAMAMALVENLQREDLNVIDQARAMQRLSDEFNLTHQQIADLLAKSRTAVSNYLRLLHLNAEVQRMLECHDLDMGHARCLLILESEQQVNLARLIAAKNLSVRETETLVARIKASKPASSRPVAHSVRRFDTLLQSLSDQLQAPVKLKSGKKGDGKLIIHYNTEHDLEQLIMQFIQSSRS